MSTLEAEPSVDQLQARLASEGLVAHAWGNGPGDRYGVHAAWLRQGARRRRRVHHVHPAARGPLGGAGGRAIAWTCRPASRTAPWSGPAESPAWRPTWPRGELGAAPRHHPGLGPRAARGSRENRCRAVGVAPHGDRARGTQRCRARRVHRPRGRDRARAAVRPVRGPVYRAAFRRLGDRQLAEEVLQDTYLALWNRAELLRSGRRLAARVAVDDRAQSGRGPAARERTSAQRPAVVRDGGR